MVKIDAPIANKKTPSGNQQMVNVIVASYEGGRSICSSSPAGIRTIWSEVGICAQSYRRRMAPSDLGRFSLDPSNGNALAVRGEWAI